MIGGAGEDTVFGNVRDRSYQDRDTLIGGAGNDLYYVDSAYDYVDEVSDSGAGIDTIISAVNLSLDDDPTVPAITDIDGNVIRSAVTPYFQNQALLVHIENLTLSGEAVVGAGNDLNNVITGNRLNNNLYGGLGNDSVYGEEGDDYVRGNDGNDVLSGGDGNDYVIGGAGADKIDGDAGDDYVRSGDDNDLTRGGDGNDYLRGMNGDDTVRGQNGDDTVEGENGNDFLVGGTGNDLALGGDGNDTLQFVDGIDTFVGGAGSDVINLSGPTGTGVVSFADVVVNGVVNGIDQISYFDAGDIGTGVVDRLDVRDLLNDLGYAITTAARQGAVSWQNNGSGTWNLFVDIDAGSRTTNVQIASFTGLVGTLDLSDLILV